MPHHYALTGNIGAGKTTVARLFAAYGVPVYYADAAAKRLMDEDSELRNALTDAFGTRTYAADGTLDRAYLADRVFGDDEALARLNGLVHPAVHRDGAAWRAAQTAAYTLYEAAILLELGRADDFDGTVVVTAPESVRRTRVLARDKATPEQFAARANRQWPEDRKAAAADFLVHNDGKQLLLPQILNLHHRLIQR